MKAGTGDRGSRMLLESFLVGMLETNCYLLADEAGRQAVVIDPGGDSDRIAQRIETLGLELSAILNTHGHFDHVMDAWALKKKLGGKIYMNSRDIPIAEQSMVTMGGFFGRKRRSTPIEIDHDLREGDTLTFGAVVLHVLETPGHTPGHLSFSEPATRRVFVGDTLFAGSIGRTDFPGGSYSRLIGSVREKIFTLDDATLVYPGHGPHTTVGAEKRTNPFFR